MRQQRSIYSHSGIEFIRCEAPATAQCSLFGGSERLRLSAAAYSVSATSDRRRDDCVISNLCDFICICNDDNDSLGCSVSEQRLSNSGHCASVSVSMFGVGNSIAALVFGNSNSFSFSVQQQPLWRRASDGSNIFGFSSQRAPCSSSSSSVSGSNSICATALASNFSISVTHRSFCATA